MVQDGINFGVTKSYIKNDELNFQKKKIQKQKKERPTKHIQN